MNLTENRRKILISRIENIKVGFVHGTEEGEAVTKDKKLKNYFIDFQTDNKISRHNSDYN